MPKMHKKYDMGLVRACLKKPPSETKDEKTDYSMHLTRYPEYLKNILADRNKNSKKEKEVI